MNSPHLDENLACDECGRDGVFNFDERKLCPDCYEAGGACCPEFGREEEDARAN